MQRKISNLLLGIGLLLGGAGNSWASITSCDPDPTPTAGETYCIGSGQDFESTVLGVINAKGGSLSRITELGGKDSASWFTLTTTQTKSDGDPIAGTWSIDPSTIPAPNTGLAVDFISIKANGGFKVYEYMSGALSGMWDTYGFGNNYPIPHGLSHITFWNTGTLASAVPILPSALLFGTGLIGLIGIARRSLFA